MPNRAYIGLGSNLGDRRANLREALERLGQLPASKVVRTSSTYESEPHGDAKTYFYNSVCELETEFGSVDVLKHLLEIEKAMGRKRAKGKKLGARIIDLDLLFYNLEVVSTKTLRLPHPRLTTRRFVLLPLGEVAPQLIHPELSTPISKILANCKDTKRVTLLPPQR